MMCVEILLIVGARLMLHTNHILLKEMLALTEFILSFLGVEILEDVTNGILYC